MPPRGSSAAVARPSARQRPPVRVVSPDYVEALRAYARLMFEGGLAPKGVKRPEEVAARIEVGRDVGLPATQAVAWIAIINGRPTIYGDAGMALILASGLLEFRRETYEGTPGEDDYTAVFEAKRVGAKEARVQRFSVGDARRANLWGKAGPWTEYPERQLMWRAKGFACRDEFPDVLCGLIFHEEAIDIPAEPPRVVVATEAKPVPAGKEPRSLTPGDGCALVGERPGVKQPDGLTPLPVTGEQLDRLADLYDLVCAAKGCKDDDARSEAWAAVLADYGVDTARDLTAGQAAELIDRLGKTHDPFANPPAVPAGQT